MRIHTAFLPVIYSVLFDCPCALGLGDRRGERVVISTEINWREPGA